MTTLHNPVTDAAVLLVALVFGALSWIVPKRRGTVAFYPSFEPRAFSGNLRPVFRRLAAAPPPGVRPIWLTRSPAVAIALVAEGLPVRLSRGRPLWTLLRAELILLDSTEPRLGFGRFRMVQAWHGSGIKRIGLEKEGRTPMRRLALRAHFRRYVLIAAASPRDAARKAECFANPAVAVLGSPRNDALLSGRGDPALAARLGLAPGQTAVSYCPTYREDGRAVPLTADGWRRLDAWAAASGTPVLVKRHVRDTALALPAGLANVRDVTALVADVQALLALSAVLVTDYSSVATDFALTGRPVVFFLWDADHFAANGRGLYADLVDLLPGPFAYDEDALLDLLRDRAWFDAPAYRVRFAEFRALFHALPDDRAAERLADAAVALIR